MQQILGEVLLAQKQPEAAILALAESLTLNPNNPHGLSLLIQAYDGLPNQAQALRTLEAQAADPEGPVFYALAQAQLHERRGEWDQALALYEILLPRQAAPVVVKNNLAYLLAEHRPTPENLARAQKLAEEVLDDNQEDPRLLDTLGWIYCRQGKYADARTHLQKAADQAPEHPMLQYHLGWCLTKLGETAPAREALSKAVAAKEDFDQRDEAKKVLDGLPKSP